MKAIGLTLLFSLIIVNSWSQDTRSHKVYFENSDGINGYVTLITKPTTVGNAYLWVQQEKVVIEWVSDGFDSYNSSNDQLAQYGVTFPFECTDCYFNTKALVSMLIRGEMQRVRVWTEESSSVHSGSLGKSNLFIPWSEDVKERHDDEEYVEGEKKAWERTGVCEEIQITSDVQGSGINKIHSAIRAYKADLEKKEEETETANKKQKIAPKNDSRSDQSEGQAKKNKTEEAEKETSEPEEKADTQTARERELSRYSSYMDSGYEAEMRGDYQSAIQYYELAYNIVSTPKLKKKIEDLKSLALASSVYSLWSAIPDADIFKNSININYAISPFHDLGIELNHISAWDNFIVMINFKGATNTFSGWESVYETAYGESNKEYNDLLNSGRVEEGDLVMLNFDSKNDYGEYPYPAVKDQHRIYRMDKYRDYYFSIGLGTGFTAQLSRTQALYFGVNSNLDVRLKMTDLSYGIGGFLKYQIGKIIIGLEYQKRFFTRPISILGDDDILYSGLYQDSNNPPTNTYSIINGQNINFYKLDRGDLYPNFNSKFSMQSFQLNIGIRLN